MAKDLMLSALGWVGFLAANLFIAALYVGAFN